MDPDGGDRANRSASDPDADYISKEKEQEKELYYHRELEAQLRKKDLEMKKLRKEVEKYYILAGVDEKDYPEQVLRHIDNAYTDEKSAVDTDTATEE